MALGRSDISRVQDLENDIRTQVNGTLADCWNTFQFVANGLEGWADETVIGSEIKQNVVKLAEMLNKLMQVINQHMGQVDNFTSQQITINKG